MQDNKKSKRQRIKTIVKGLGLGMAMASVIYVSVVYESLKLAVKERKKSYNT